MRILMIGGTRFVGRHIAGAAMARGHQVTLFHRGRTGAGLFPEVEHRYGDRDTDLSALAEGQWDATVDVCAYLPGQVRALAQTLGERAGHYVLVSTVSVYDDPPSPGATEAAPLVELDDPDVAVVTSETYGGLKVLCERAAVASFGAGTLAIRPTYVVGPDDYTGRFPHWVERISRGGEVLLPGPADDPSQVIDVRDMGAWIVGLVEAGRAGALHAASPRPPWSWADTMSAIADTVAPAGTTLTWVDAPFLRAQGVDDRSLPLWSGGDAGRFIFALDPSAAYASGLSPRPLADTVRDTLAWLRSPEGAQRQHVGLSSEREDMLLRAWHER
ncbi:MAG TPA: NAD-dependent epimerase/dehydratase family protein [Actinomycetes bacterium]|nr:NAD-dependent epimerase/dehydratase family protein [Actinomycetes bacterium]